MTDEIKEMIIFILGILAFSGILLKGCEVQHEAIWKMEVLKRTLPLQNEIHTGGGSLEKTEGGAGGPPQRYVITEHYK